MDRPRLRNATASPAKQAPPGASPPGDGGDKAGMTSEPSPSCEDLDACDGGRGGQLLVVLTPPVSHDNDDLLVAGITGEKFRPAPGVLAEVCAT